MFNQKPLNFSTQFTFRRLSSSPFRTEEIPLFSILTFSIWLFFFHCISALFSRFISFWLCFYIFFSLHDFNVSKIIFSVSQSQFSFFLIVYGTKKITTTKFKRQSSSVGWKLKKIICYVGKYKGNFFLVSVCAWIWERLLIRYWNLSYLSVATTGNIGKIVTRLLPGRLISFVNQRDYQNLNICFKNRKLFTSLFTSSEQVKE